MNAFTSASPINKNLLLYLSNFLSASGVTPQPCELIVPGLSDTFSISTASSRKNYLLRIIDFLSTFFKNRKRSSVLLLDVYAYKSFYLACLMAALARLSKIPYICILHSHYLLPRLKARDTLIRSLLSGSAVNISPSAFLQQYTREYNPPSQVIPNPLQAGLYHFKNRNMDSPRILWLRTVYHKYNPQLAIYCLALLKKKYPEASLSFVGPQEKDTYRQCQEISRSLQLDKSIQYHGYLDKAAWIKLSEQHNVFLNTTNWDNAPVSLLEAAALGLPIVSSRVGGIPFLFEHEKNCLLAEPGQAEDFARQIHRLFEEKELPSRLSQQAYTLARQHDWPQVKKQWVQLLSTFENPYPGTAH